jgi:hypothetical protein
LRQIQRRRGQRKKCTRNDLSISMVRLLVRLPKDANTTT